MTDVKLWGVFGKVLDRPAEWIEWAKEIVLSFQPEKDQRGNYRNRDSALDSYFCRLLWLLQDSLPESNGERWVATSILRPAFFSGIALCGCEKHWYGDAFEGSLQRAELFGHVRKQERDEWRPGMKSGSGWITYVLLTPAGERAAWGTDGPSVSTAGLADDEPAKPTPPSFLQFWHEAKALVELVNRVRACVWDWYQWNTDERIDEPTAKSYAEAQSNLTIAARGLDAALRRKPWDELPTCWGEQEADITGHLWIPPNPLLPMHEKLNLLPRHTEELLLDLARERLRHNREHWQGVYHEWKRLEDLTVATLDWLETTPEVRHAMLTAVRGIGEEQVVAISTPQALAADGTIATQSGESAPAPAGPEQEPAEREADNSTPEADGNDGPLVDESVLEGKQAKKAKQLAEALILLQQHPDWSDREIAKRVCVHPATLGRWPEYKALKANQSKTEKDIPRGFKNSCTGDMDAWHDESDD